MKKAEGVPYFLLIAFMIAGLGLICFGVIKQGERREQLQQYEMTWGYISDYVGNNRSGESENFAAVHSYEVDGEEYSFRDSVYTGRIPKVGKKEKIMYDPDDPSEAFVKEGLSVGFVCIFMGIVAIVYPILIIIATSCNIGDRWREFIKCMLLGGVFAGAGFGFCFGGIGRLTLPAAISFILGCFGVYFISYGIYSLKK